VNPTLLDALQKEIDTRVAKAAADQKVEWSKEDVQHNRAGGTADTLKDRRAHPLVQTAVDIHRFLKIDIGPEGAVATGSTDSNAAVIRGIPSISVGRARGGDQHTLKEWAERDSVVVADKMLLLLALSMAGIR
jgi:di/tripeptidase